MTEIARSFKWRSFGVRQRFQAEAKLRRDGVGRSVGAAGRTSRVYVVELRGLFHAPALVVALQPREQKPTNLPGDPRPHFRPHDKKGVAGCWLQCELEELEESLK